jgi:hypothetical protein
MANESGLGWKRREIRAYVVSSDRYPFSEPLTLLIGNKGENLDGEITSLVHELAHTLFDDNGKVLKGYWALTVARPSKVTQTRAGTRSSSRCCL